MTGTLGELMADPRAADAQRSLGERLATLRHMAGLNQAQLAAHVSYSRSTVANTETGRQRAPIDFWRRCDQVLEANGELVAAYQQTTGPTHHQNRNSYALVGQPRWGGQEVRSPSWTTSLQDQALAADDEARAAARFAHQVASGVTSTVAMEYLEVAVCGLARRYVSTPLFDLFSDIRGLRIQVFTMIDDNRCPSQMRDLHLAASRLCGLQAHVCLDLGQYPQADDLARTAWLCANLADHPGMRGWVRALQSLIAYWDNRPADALNAATDGMTRVHEGSITIRLSALQARAASALADRPAALRALEAAERARERLRDDDKTGGLFVFPQAKQETYAGTTLLTLGCPALMRQAIDHSRRAIAHYETAAPPERSSGDLCAAHLDLAQAYLRCDDLDASDHELRVVLAQPPTQRTASIRTRVTQLADRLTAPRYEPVPLARDMRGAIDGFHLPLTALPSSGGASHRSGGIAH
ncbi:MAG: helix-turn-helix domain-containing protein [Dactylosporangium sp.]|nr:helix-turn-helix domain-containing protein [Dactylosporangium sp.]NNJ62155.1 helix-turn-helix domain-containing protein [Dactylosporangium sp.]